MSTDLSTIFVSNLKSALKQKEMTASKLAFRMGINSGYIYQLLSGGKNPGLKTIEKIAEALDMDAMDLLKGRSN